jgi:hypothetical protein
MGATLVSCGKVKAMSDLYPTSGVDSSQISPSDAAVTLRSLPRRFASVLATPDDDDRPDDVLRRRPQSGGLSAIEHGAWVAAAHPGIAQALHRVLIETNPTIEVPPLEPDGPVDGGDRSSADTVAAIAASTGPLADLIDGVAGDDWLRSGRIDGQPVTALDVARGAVQLGVYHLRTAERTVREVAHEAR